MARSLNSELVKIGNEQAVVLREGEVSLLFGRGPAQTDLGYQERAASILAALRPELRALRWCNQVHGKLGAALADDSKHTLSGSACVGRCDGLITDATGLGLMVWTADCVPVIIFGGGVVAAVHSGWRGCAAEIVPSMVRRFEVEYGVPVHELRAVIGPAVGSCHYQVGDEVLSKLSELQPTDSFSCKGNRVDLRAFVELRLHVAGLDRDSIFVVGGCTACDPGFASYRRDGRAAGRQFSAVYRGPKLSPVAP